MPEAAPRVKRSVILSRAQDDALKARSEELGKASINSLIRQAIDQWLKHQA